MKPVSIKKYGPYSRRIIRCFTIILAMTILVACAASAPKLPDDTTASNRQHSISLADFSADDAAMDCKALETEQSANSDKIAVDNQAIASNRQQNEVVGYMGGIAIFPLVAVENNAKEKDDIATLQQRQDVLRKLAAVKNCR